MVNIKEFLIASALGVSVVVGGYATLLHFEPQSVRNEREIRMKIEGGLEERMEDVNRDGIIDVVGKKVLLGQKDRQFITLDEARNKEINEIYQDYETKRENIEKKYTPRYEEKRNNVDNLDYNVRTGRILVGK